MKNIEEDNEPKEEQKNELTPLDEYQQMFTSSVKLYKMLPQYWKKLQPYPND